MSRWFKLLIFMVLIPVMGYPQESDFNNFIKWISLEEAGKLFTEKQKPIFVWFYSVENDSCKLMNDSVFGLNEINTYINSLFYPVKINAKTIDTITFLDGTKIAKSNAKNPYHDLVYQMLGENPVFPSILVFNRQAEGNIFSGFKKRDQLFPILIYYHEDIYKSTVYETYENYYFKAYPPGQKQIMTRLIIKWKLPEELAGIQKIKPRKILLELYYPYNTSATVMKLTTYNNPVIAKYLNENFYPVSINVFSTDTIVFNDIQYFNEGKAHGYHQIAIAALEGKMIFPAMIILDENYQVQYRFQQYFTPEDIEPILHFYGTDSYKTMPYPDFYKTFKSSFESKK